MGDLSKNFNRSEFVCRGQNCCDHSAAVHPGLVDALQALRDRIDTPLSIASGFRCNRYNKDVNGAKHSFHTLGMAADVNCPAGISPEGLALIAEEISLFREGGIGIYPDWVHVDVRTTGKARWRQ
jgi:uncharacterized protein YcbK (DUF882 family)